MTLLTEPARPDSSVRRMDASSSASTSALASMTAWIMDSWVEPSRASRPEVAQRVILQVVPLGRRQSLMILEADLALIPDAGWFEDLRENLCHGLGVEVTYSPTCSADVDARIVSLRLDR